ncbi:hypothetical protein RF11_10960 [Thelohanellus kitauei]|uniref:Uncharacterized protein n=1 Tax=Thelohanellus kitauei TaxID=669202 RepID=A0A0C2MGB6_THEKT|nr:hypothetical protein RF11_10960 [Thelohanellus kitauei]
MKALVLFLVSVSNLKTFVCGDTEDQVDDLSIKIIQGGRLSDQPLSQMRILQESRMDPFVDINGNSFDQFPIQKLDNKDLIESAQRNLEKLKSLGEEEWLRLPMRKFGLPSNIRRRLLHPKIDLMDREKDIKQLIKEVNEKIDYIKSQNNLINSKIENFEQLSDNIQKLSGASFIWEAISLCVLFFIVILYVILNKRKNIEIRVDESYKQELTK